MHSKVLASILSLCLLSVFLIGSINVSAAKSWFVASETVTTGTSNGYANQQQSDSLVNTKTEADNAGGVGTAALLLSDDESLDWEYVGPTPQTTCLWLPVTHAGATRCPDEPDANTSYVTTTINLGPDNDAYDRIGVEDPSWSAEVQIVQLMPWAWARMNTSGDAMQLYLNLTQPGGDCVMQGNFPLNLAWQNITPAVGYAVACDDAAAWEVTDFDNLAWVIYVLGNDNGRASYTYGGVEVTYYNDQELSFTSEFNDVKGTSMTLNYQCTTTDQDSTLEVTYLAINRGQITCDGVFRTFQLPTDQGTIQVTLSSTTTDGDWTASTFSFDALYLTTIVTDGDDTNNNGTGDPLELQCNAEILAIRCRVHLNTLIPGIQINQTHWYLDSKFKILGRAVDESGLNHEAVISSFAFPSANFTVTVVAYLITGEVHEKSTVVMQDNSWIILVIMLALILIAVMIVGLASRAKAKREKVAVEKEPEDNWRMRLW